MKMDQNIDTNLDSVFKRFLQILRPYLGQLLDQNVIDICNAWIKKLSNCNENEKSLRNKYVFVMCYQLAKGVLGEPFLDFPPPDELLPIHDDSSSDSSFTEVEYLVIDSESQNTKVRVNNRSQLQIFTEDSGINVDKHKETSCTPSTCDLQNSHSAHTRICNTDVQSYSLPYKNDKLNKCYECDENYQFRANNLIMKLREIKQQNILLHEMVNLRQESKLKHDIDDSFNDSILKIDNATSTCNYHQNSDSTLTSLKHKLQEVQHSRNDLIDTIGSLQDKLDHYNEIKKHEIEEIESKHKLEIINLKSSLREEIKAEFESKLSELKNQHEKLILDIKSSTKADIEKFCKSKEEIILEKDRLLQAKETEITTLKCQLEELKSLQFTVLNRFTDTSIEKRESARSYELEKRLSKMEKTKNKCARAYEAKVASLQREKHLAEYSLQLQLVKQRAQVLNEVTEENQVELATALDKLENKYKEIVGNVQATAVQRRLQDQIALGSLIQAVCGAVPKGNSYASPTNANTGQFSGKTLRNQSKDQECSRTKEIGTFCNSNRVDNVCVGNKSFGEDSVGAGYCLDSEKLQELFERVHIPQKDVGDITK